MAKMGTHGAFLLELAKQKTLINPRRSQGQYTGFNQELKSILKCQHSKQQRPVLVLIYGGFLARPCLTSISVP